MKSFAALKKYEAGANINPNLYIESAIPANLQTFLGKSSSDNFWYSLLEHVRKCVFITAKHYEELQQKVETAVKRIQAIDENGHDMLIRDMYLNQPPYQVFRPQ